MAERQKVLNLVNAIASGPMTTDSLMARFGAGNRTVKRWISEARQLGARLRARRIETNEEGRLTGPYYWEVENLEEIQPRLQHWVSLETTASLTDNAKENRHD